MKKSPLPNSATGSVTYSSKFSSAYSGSPQATLPKMPARVMSPLNLRICGVTIRQRPPKELHDLYTEINRIGTNINQIARKANAGFATKDDMRELKFLMRAVEQRMAKVADP